MAWSCCSCVRPDVEADGVVPPSCVDPISSSQDPKRFELQKLVCDFVREASNGGQHCEAMKVGGSSGLQTVQYQLDRSATKLELKDISTGGVLICWNVNDILLRKGEDADTWPHTATLTAATLAQSLEISVGGHGSWCLVAKNQKERDRFVCAIQILQLYHSLQNQLATNFSTPKKSEMEGYGEGGLLRPPTTSPATSLVSPFARKAPAPPPTPQKLEFSENAAAGL